MGLFDLSTASEDLEDLFERERDAVLNGNFDQLERLSSEKERLVQIVAKDGAPALVLARLQESSERNGVLLDAMRAGVVAAQTRLKAMRSPNAPLQTYDATGRRKTIAIDRKTNGRRA